MIEMLELFDKYFKASMIKVHQKEIMKHKKKYP